MIDLATGLAIICFGVIIGLVMAKAYGKKKEVKKRERKEE